MLLAADVGNTNVVFALIEGREIKSRWRIATDPRRTGDEYAVWLLQLAEFQGFDKSDGDIPVAMWLSATRAGLQAIWGQGGGIGGGGWRGGGGGVDGRRGGVCARLVRGGGR